MPAVAIAGAIFAGVELATVGVAALSIFEVVAAVGAITAGVGVVTGNNDLVKIGGLATLAGGIGSFAQGKGWLAGDELTGGAEGVGATGDFARMDRAASNTSELTAQTAPGVADPAAQLAGADPIAGSQAPGSTGDFAQLDRAGEATTTSSAITEPNSLLNGPVADTRSGADILAGFDKKASGGIFDRINDIGKYVEKNKTLSSIAGNFIGGAFDSKKKAEGEYYSARASNERLQGDIARQQQINANAVPDLTGLNVRPDQVYANRPTPTYAGVRPGLINSTGR